VGLEDPGTVAAQDFTHARLDIMQLATCLQEGRFQAEHLPRNLVGGERVVGYGMVVRPEQQNRPRGDARGSSNPPEFEFPLGLH